ncbi:toll/interleukin-1 receptor domain-containing protein [Ktedonobacteria bacterium brp13]|nr:toll/interleukin-1 receptor domain-containing protein [Ktedonobacteria bacterium brp13]
MASTRIFVSYATAKSSRRERDMAAQLILDLQTAKVEVITASESISDENFMQFLYKELPQCQYIVLVQNSEAIQSSRVQSTINLALTLASQGRIKEVLRFIVTSSSLDKEPRTLAKLRTFDATQDYLRARDKLLLDLNLFTLEKDPEETFIAPPELRRSLSEGAPKATAGSLDNVASMVSRSTQNTVEPSITDHSLEKKEQVYADLDKQQAPLPVGKTAQPTRPQEQKGKFLASRHKQTQIDRPAPLRQKYQIPPLWIIIFSAIQVLTLIFAIGVLIWGRAANTTAMTTPLQATPSVVPSAFTNQLNTQILSATQSQQNPYGRSNNLVVNDVLDGSSAANDYGWDNLNNGQSMSCHFANQSYILISNGPGSCLATKTSYKNLTYQIQMTIAQGQAGGLTFRANIAQHAYFKFEITVNGNYVIERNDNNNLDYQLAGGFSPAIKQGLNQTNLISINANNQTLDFYVNLQHVASLQDNHDQSPGSIGVVASGPNEDFTTQVSFKYAKVWSSDNPNP